MKKIILAICTVFFFCGLRLSPVIGGKSEPVPVRLVVIDAGHGGKDPGTIGKRTQEKYVTLSVARKLGELITSGMPGVRVIYTRDRDEFIELYERSGIANRNKADLFISIHCNANRNKTLRGAETYVMGLHKSGANLEVAKFENASILMEADYNHVYDGFDPNSDESYITFSLFQNTNLDLSTNLAALIQEQMEERVGLNDRGVRQAGFLVLYRTTMPSVLVEIGYLSNAEEESFLISPKGQDFIANAIYRAVRNYAQGPGSVTQEVKPSKTDKADTPAAAPTKKMTTPPAQNPPVVARKAEPKPGPAPVTSTEKKETGIFFRVQVATSPQKLETSSSRFRGLTGVGIYRHEGLYKYTVGNEKSFKDALKILNDVKGKGYKDAFIVAFKNGERIPVDKARTMTGQ